MKAFIAALVLITLSAAPSFAQYYGQVYYWPAQEYGQSPASPTYGSNGY